MTPLPINAETTVRRWHDLKNYGFLVNPDAGERDIFVHYTIIPARLGVGKALKPNDRVKIKYVQGEDQRFTCTELQFIGDARSPGRAEVPFRHGEAAASPYPL